MTEMGRVQLFLFPALAAVILFPTAPAMQPVPPTDSGVFLYAGRRILDGGLPYLAIWDHKPPMIFYINALGLLLAGGSAWGVWMLEVLAIAAASLTAFFLLRAVFRPAVALFCSLLLLMTLGLALEEGNLVETYALPLQFLLLALFVLSINRERPFGTFYVMGLLSGVLLLLKPNAIAIPLAVAAYAGIHALRSRIPSSSLISLLMLVFGTVTVLSFWIVLALMSGILTAFTDAAIQYNVAYSHTTIATRLRAVTAGIKTIAPSGIAFLGFSGWLATVFALARSKSSADGAQALLAVCVGALPLEVVLAAVSGRSYAHYYVSWLPTLTILAGFALDLVMSGVERGYAGQQPFSASSTFKLAFLAILFGSAIGPLGVIARPFLQSTPVEATLRQAANYVNRSTRDSDYVLMWGTEVGVNFATGRRSPSRFAYQLPFYTPGYRRPDLTAEFLRDIAVNRPTLIIDASAATGGAPPLEANARRRWLEENGGELYPEIEDVVQFVCTHYASVGVLGEQRWPVYAWAGNSSVPAPTCDIKLVQLDQAAQPV